MKKMSLLLTALALALAIPLTAEAKAPGGPFHIDLGLGWSSSLNNYSSSHYDGTEAQGPNFFLGVKFRVAPSFMLGLDLSLAVQPWSYGYDYDYGYDYGYGYDYRVSAKNRIFFSGDATLTFYPIRLFYVMVGAGFSGLNLSYETSYGSGGLRYDDLDGTEFGWNGLVALGLNIPLGPFFRIGFELRYQGGYIMSGEELYDFNLFSGNVTLSFL